MPTQDVYMLCLLRMFIFCACIVCFLNHLTVFCLFRMLRSLLTAHGVNPSMITVFIDGYFEVSSANCTLYSYLVIVSPCLALTEYEHGGSTPWSQCRVLSHSRGERFLFFQTGKPRMKIVNSVRQLVHYYKLMCALSAIEPVRKIGTIKFKMSSGII